MHSITKIFDELKERPVLSGDIYNIASLPSIKNHKIGISEKRQPIFFIKCEETSPPKLVDSKLEFITVRFNQQCQLYNLNNKIENGIYTIISLKAESVELQEYFLDVIYSVIQKISEKPKLKEIKIEVDKLINLFSLLTKPPIKTIQGLWAELFLMEQSLCPDYLVKSWHNSVFDKFDFNDGFDKIEVKSTSSNRRIHTFSLEQLNPNVGSSLIIASVFTIETGVGKSIFDLVYNIERKLIEKNLIFRLNEIILYTIGNNFERAFEVYFDYQYAIDTIKYYESSIIPTINKVDVPLEVTKVRFDCELTDLANTTTFKSNSILHKSIYIK